MAAGLAARRTEQRRARVGYVSTRSLDRETELVAAFRKGLETRPTKRPNIDMATVWAEVCPYRLLKTAPLGYK